MNYYQIVAFAQNLKKQNMAVYNNDRDPNDIMWEKQNDSFINDAYEEETKLHTEFMNEVVYHDYSYMMSDSHSVYMSGRNHEKQIEEKLHALINICRYAADDLLDEVISAVPQRYNDVDSNGNDLTHRVIRSWFKPYLESI